MEEKKPISTLIKVVPIRRQVGSDSSDSSKRTYDSLLLFYRDKDGKRQCEFVPRAKVPYSIIKDKESPEAQSGMMFIPADKVEKFETYSDLLTREIAVKCDATQYFQEATYTPGVNPSTSKNLLKHRWVYDADMDVADRYIQYFHEKYEPDINYQLKKGYADIEVDLMVEYTGNHLKGKTGDEYYEAVKKLKGYDGFPDEEKAPAPVALICYFYEPDKTFHLFILREEENLSQKDFLGKTEEFKKFVIQWIKENDNLDVSVELHVYDSELELIEEYFDLIHRDEPDFLEYWNAGYDCLTLQNRLITLNQRKMGTRSKWDVLPTVYETINDKKYLWQKDSAGEDIYIDFKPYYKQEKDKNIVDRTECFTVCDSINTFDAMGLFASIRKFFAA